MKNKSSGGPAEENTEYNAVIGQPLAHNPLYGEIGKHIIIISSYFQFLLLSEESGEAGNYYDYPINEPCSPHPTSVTVTTNIQTSPAPDQTNGDNSTAVTSACDVETSPNPAYGSSDD